MSISATWNRSRDNGGSPVLDYNITLLEANSSVQQSQSGIRETFYTLRHLRQNRTYTLLLQARNVVGYGNSANATVSTLAAGKMLFCIFFDSGFSQSDICGRNSVNHPFTHSINHSLTHPLIHSFHFISFHLFIDPFTHSFMHVCMRSFINAFIRACIYYIHAIHSFIHSVGHSIISSFLYLTS